MDNLCCSCYEIIAQRYFPDCQERVIEALKNHEHFVRNIIVKDRGKKVINFFLTAGPTLVRRPKKTMLSFLAEVTNRYYVTEDVFTRGTRRIVCETVFFVPAIMTKDKKGYKVGRFLYIVDKL